jgi:excisionase family DNA binding protein
LRNRSCALERQNKLEGLLHQLLLKGKVMETLTCAEAASFLKIHYVTLSVLASSGEVPGAKIGRRWVFLKADLIIFLKSKYRIQPNSNQTQEQISCQFLNVKTPPIGGSKLQPQMGDAYNKALGLPKK